MTQDLKRKTLSGFGWNGIAQVVRQALQFAFGVVLARALSPDDFGLFGMIVVFTGFANITIDMGLGTAIVQKKDMTERHLDAIFWTNFATGVALCLLTCALAPVIAAFFGRPELRLLATVAGLEFVIGPFRLVQDALLQKTMNFRRLCLIQSAALLVSGGVAVTMATNGYGVWSLVVRSLVHAGCQAVLLWVLSSWRPSLGFRWKALKELSSFGLNLFGYYAVNYWMRNADNLLVGRYLGERQLGFYSRGYNFMLMPLRTLSQSLSRVMLPALASVQDDNARTVRIYFRSLRSLAIAVCPCMTGLLVVARPFVLTVYGAKWEGLIPILQCFCLVGVIDSLSGSAGWLCIARGRTDLLFRWGIYVAFVTIPMFLVGLRWGALGVAACYAVSYFVFLMVPSWWVFGRIVDLKLSDVWRAVGGPLLCSALMGCVVFVVGEVLPSAVPDWLRLAVEVPLGIVVYGLLVFLTGQEGARDLAGIIRTRKRPVAEQAGAELPPAGRDAERTGLRAE